MAFIAAFLTPIIGAVGAEIAAGVAQVGAGLGLSYLANKLTAKKAPATSTTSTASGSQGVHGNLTLDANASRQVIMGTASTPGSLVYWQLSGDNNDLLEMVIALADHPCDSLRRLYVNGKNTSWDATSGEVTGFGSNFVIKFFSGALGQSSASSIVSHSGGRWTSAEKGSGVCYVTVALKYTAELFPSGIPKLTFVVKGASLYDPRLDTTAGGSGSQRRADQSTWAFSDNPAVVAYNVIRGFSCGGRPLIGMNAPAAAVRFSDYAAAANSCDEILLKKSGASEFRYRIGAIFDAAQSNSDFLETIAATMAGEIVEAGGVYRIFAGVAQASVATLSDADIIVDKPLTIDRKRPRSELTNAVQASFTDPAQGYTVVPLPPRTSSADETTDGGVLGPIRLAQTLDLSAVQSRSQAQRIMEVQRKRSRRQVMVTFTARSRWFVLEPGDWITFGSARRGLSNMTFEVLQRSVNADLATLLTLREVDAAIDDWTPSTDEIDDNQVVDLASAGPPLTTPTGLTLSNTLVVSDGVAEHPGLLIEWDAIADGTVIGLDLEYRRYGDTVALSRTINDASSGEYVWVDGIQGSTQYEARLRLQTLPVRPVDWTGWARTVINSDPQVVEAAGIAAAVPPGTITRDMMNAQADFEYGLSAAASEILGSMASIREQTRTQLQNAADAAIAAAIQANKANIGVKTEVRTRADQDLVLSERIDSISAVLDDTSADISELTQAVTDGQSSLASLIQTLQSQVGANIASIQILTQTINGVTSKFAVTVNSNNEITGFISLDGSSAGTAFTVATDAFYVGKAGTTGGTAVPVFAIQNVNGVAKIALRGDMWADGTIIARMIQAGSITADKLTVTSLASLSANLGMVRTGYIISPDGATVFDLAASKWVRADGTFVLDAAQKIFRMEF